MPEEGGDGDLLRNGERNKEMRHKQIFSDFQTCLSAIQDDFDLKLANNKPDNPTVLLRGESALFEKTESAMKRFLVQDDGTTMKPFYYVSPFIDFEDIYSDYHSDCYGLSKDEGLGFLQHYGFPTDLFDLSPSVDTTRFFASHGNADSETGMVGVFLTCEMQKYFTIVDLSKHPDAKRPQRQVAYAARPLRGSYDLKDEQNDKLFTTRWYEFYKSNEDLEFARERQYFIYPTERELAHFFGQDLLIFCRNHQAYKKMDQQQRDLLEKKLASIRNSLRPLSEQKAIADAVKALREAGTDEALAEAVVTTVGRAYYWDREAIETFLNRPHPLLDGQTPFDMARSNSAGADAVLNLLRRAEASVAL